MGEAGGDPGPTVDDWRVTMRWSELLFAHWPVDASALRPLVHEGVEIETFDGKAWLGVIPFVMSRVRLRGLPPLPGVRRFAELNVRTYVRRRGERGVWFFSLDASAWAAVVAARSWYRLNYRWARMRVVADAESGEVGYASRRRDGSAAFDAVYGPTGEPARAEPGTLGHFLTERRLLFTRGRGGRLFRAPVRHAPWRLRPAEASIALNTMASPLGIDLAGPAADLRYADPVDTVAGAPALLGEGG